MVTTPERFPWRTEARWPAILAMLLTLGLLESLPGRYAVAGLWFPAAICAVGVASMLAVAIAPAKIVFYRIERATVIAIATLACALSIVTLGRIVADMLAVKHDVSSITMLETAICLWVGDIIIFALLYWQIDRSGPRIRDVDFDFAQEHEVTSPTGWEPQFVDYLFVSFVSSTSFNPPDSSRPTTHRIKLLIMLQASISLANLFLIAARGISTLS